MTLVCGVGKNDADYIVNPTINGIQIRCPFYRTWRSMLTRCYSDLYHKYRPTYSNCTVCLEWHSFMNFRIWMISQDWEGKQLDKDILVEGNKIYSPETCLFVDKFINNLLHKNEKSKNGLPTGVHFCNTTDKFIATMSVDGKRKNLGSFYSSIDADLVYREFKSDRILEVAKDQKDTRLRHDLELYAKNIWRA